MVIALYSFPHSHPGAHACSHPLLTRGCRSHTHAYSGSLTPHLPPYLFMSLLVHGHRALGQTQSLRRVLVPTPAYLALVHPSLALPLTHTILCFKCTLIPLMIDRLLSYSNQ